jgi:type II secretory pathway component GspD/PulD (secretin)
MTLLIGSTIDQRVIQMVDRVPYLSEIPIAGRLFIKRSLHTNQLRQVLFLLRAPEGSKRK